MALKKNIFGFFNRGRSENNSESTENNSLHRFSQTLKGYFSTEPEKEKVLNYKDFDAAGDTYYAGISAWYKIFQRVFFVGFIVFSLASVLFNFKHITYDNFFYLVKDFNTAVDTENVNYETLSYDASTDQSFTLYRGGLAVVSRSKVSAFTATGRRTLNSNVAYSKPFVISSDKYLLVYDMGDSTFSVYNSFVKVYSEKLDYPITGACFSDSGRFAILTRSAEYDSEIIVYSEDFDRVAKYSRSAYAIDISLDKDGERLGAVYVETKNGIVDTKVVFYDVKEHKKLVEYSYSGEFPLSCSFLDGGGFAAITDGSVKIFGRALDEKRTSQSYTSAEVSASFADGSYIAVAFNNGIITDQNEIIVFDKKGELVYNKTILSAVEQLALCDGYVFAKSSTGVLRLRMKDSSQQHLVCQDGTMLVYDKATALVCAQSKAVYLKFDD